MMPSLKLSEFFPSAVVISPIITSPFHVCSVKQQPDAESHSPAPTSGCASSAPASRPTPPHCHDTAVGAPRRLVGFDNDLAAAIPGHGGGGDAAVRQVENDGGSVAPLAHS
jgi:hypothetical protein